jgi:hypothetical protein
MFACLIFFLLSVVMTENLEAVAELQPQVMVAGAFRAAVDICQRAMELIISWDNIQGVPRGGWWPS